MIHSLPSPNRPFLVLTLLVACALTALSAFDAAAAPSVVPRYVSYQGILTDDAGNIVPDGDYSINFRLYTAESGGTQLWNETQIVTTTDGVFDVRLGAVNPLTVVTFYRPMWLTMLIEGMAVSTPRTPILSSPYSFRAASLEDDALTAQMIANGTLVRSINGLRDTVNLVSGSNVSISQAGQDITISASGGTGGDDGDWTISGAHLYRDGSGSVAIGTSTVQPWSSNQTMLQVGASMFPSIALDRVGGGFQRWMLMQDTFSNALWIGPAASPTSPPTPNIIMKDTGRVGIGITPIATLSVLGGNGDLSTTNGDFSIGAGNNVFKVGLTNTGLAAGRVTMRAMSSNAPSIALGTGTKDAVVIDDDELNFYGDASAQLIRLGGDPVESQGGILQLFGHTGVVRSRITLDAQNGNNAVMTLRKDDGQLGVLASSGSGSNGGKINLYSGTGVAIIQMDATYNGGSGRIRTPTLEITGGSDLSEQFTVNANDSVEGELGQTSTPALEPEPGLVVAIDPANPGELMLSNVDYDRRVAGVISGAGGVRPGMLMGQEGSVADGDHPVALTGRVYVWVDASEHSVEPGDLLTTSAVTGHAMKVTDHSRAVGAILGKAMTRLESGRGLVLTLVSLQ